MKYRMRACPQAPAVKRCPRLDLARVALQNTPMIALRLPSELQVHAMAGMDRMRFIQNILEAVSFPGAGLPRGYFCSVTPP